MENEEKLGFFKKQWALVKSAAANMRGALRMTKLVFSLAPGMCVLIIALGLAGGVISPIRTLLIAHAGTLFALGSRGTELILTVAGLALASTASALLNNVASLVQERADAKTRLPIKRMYIEACKRVDIRTREQFDFSMHAMVANLGLSFGNSTTLGATVGIFSTLISTVAAFVLVAKVSLPLALLTIPLSLVQLWLEYRARAQKFENRHDVDMLSYRQSRLIEKIQDRYAFAELKAARRFEWLVEKWKKRYDIYVKAKLKHDSRDLYATTFAPMLLTLGVYALLGLFGATGAGAAGDTAAAVAGVMLISNSLLSLSSNMGALAGSLGTCDTFGSHCNDYFYIVDKKWEGVRGEGSNTECGDITLQNVSFSYDGSVNAVDDVSFVLKKGERLAVVGENGSGKSTLAKLLLQLYKPNSGTIRYEGVDGDCRATTVMQHYMRYDMTVRENIAMGDVDRVNDDEALLSAWRDVCGSELFLKLDEMLGIRFGGRELSGGEWQRIAIARAFLRKAPLVVLDEPNASIDAFAEGALIRSMFNMSEGRACVFITHRLTTTAMADRIIVMKQGRIVEEGTHAQLMALHGEYERMFTTQSKMYA